MNILKLLLGYKFTVKRVPGIPKLEKHSRGLDEPFHDPHYYTTWRAATFGLAGIYFISDEGMLSEWYINWKGELWRPVTNYMCETIYRRVDHEIVFT